MHWSLPYLYIHNSLSMKISIWENFIWLCFWLFVSKAISYNNIFHNSLEPISTIDRMYKAQAYFHNFILKSKKCSPINQYLKFIKLSLMKAFSCWWSSFQRKGFNAFKLFSIEWFLWHFISISRRYSTFHRRYLLANGLNYFKMKIISAI